MILTVETKRIAPDIAVLQFTGKITLGRESQRIETLVQSLLGEGTRKFIFDLAGVDYIDSAGLGVITLCGGTAAEAGGGMRVAGAQGLAQRLFKITKLDSVIPCYESVEAARDGW